MGVLSQQIAGFPELQPSANASTAFQTSKNQRKPVPACVDSSGTSTEVVGCKSAKRGGICFGSCFFFNTKGHVLVQQLCHLHGNETGFADNGNVCHSWESPCGRQHVVEVLNAKGRRMG